MSKPNYIKVPKTARYYSSSVIEGQYQNVCFVLHGYGQLAPYFIKSFQHSELKKTLFVAPEGLHRFYLKDSEGRVGASWMTKEERLIDIEDYCNYLDLVFDEVLSKLSSKSKVGILGFSQGVATACRWLTFSKHTFSYLINWAGAFPPDLPHSKAVSRMQKLPIYMLLGDNDEYISLEKRDEHILSLQNGGFNIESKTFKGNHKIYKEPLVDLFLSKVI